MKATARIEEYKTIATVAAAGHRVMIVSDQFPPAKGGIGDYTALLSDALVDCGVRVSLFVPEGSDPTACRAPIAGTFDTWSWAALSELHRTLVATDTEWIHLQHNGGMYSSCRLAAYFLPRHLRWKRWPGKIAVTFHDINRPPLFPKAGRLRDWVLGDLARNADVALAADDSDLAALRRLGAPARQIPIGSNIPSVDPNDMTRESIRSRYCIPVDDTLLGHFGTSIGLDTVFRALPSLVKTSLLLIGKTPEVGSPGDINQVPKELHALLESTGCSQRVHWTSHLSAKEVSDALDACDVVVLPYPAGASLRHGGLIAAICHGRAIVTTTPKTPLGNPLGEQTFLAVPPGNVGALAAAVQKISSDKDTKTSLEAAAVAVRDYFSWSNIAREHISCYQTQATGAAQ